jgi:hypothetical protein
LFIFKQHNFRQRQIERCIHSRQLTGRHLPDLITNFDPIFGGETERLECRAVILSYFPNSVITEPDAVGFAGAVPRVWGATSGALIFHLEDDWVLNEEIHPDDVIPHMTGKSKSIVLVAKELRWNGHDNFKYRRKRIKFLGFSRGRRGFQIFEINPPFPGWLLRRPLRRIDGPGP